MDKHNRFKPVITSLLTVIISFCAMPLQAATITVTGSDGSVVADGSCSISEAIINANDDAPTHSDCAGGSGTDTINFDTDITLMAEYENDGTFGRTGTPPISTPIVIDAQGHVLERDGSLTCNNDNISDSGEFRQLRVISAGNLALNNAVIRGGCTDGVNGAGYGGGLLNRGTLSLQNSVIDANQAGIGGGIASIGGGSAITTIDKTTFSNNNASYIGGGLFGQENIGAINNSTFSGNTAYNGGGIYLSFIASISVINNSTFSGNIANSGSAIYGDESSINNLINSLFHDGSTCGGSTLLFNGINNMADGTSGSGCPGIIGTAIDTATVGSLADNGCTTPLADGSCVMTHALLAGSRPLDAAETVIITDQRGFNADGDRDIGAYEAQLPVITAPADMTIEATGPSTTSPALGTATATDVDSDDLALTITNDAAASYALGVYTITWTVTDNHGHQGTDTQSLTVEDTTPPVLSLMGTSPINLNVGDSYSDAGATATDLVDDDTVLTSNISVNNPVNTNLAGSYTVSYDVTDNAGNPAAQISRTVNVNGTPQIQLSTASIDFGGVLIGQNDTAIITVTNSGNVNLNLNSIGALAAPFEVSGGSCNPLPMTLTPGNDCTIEITYSPSAAGNDNAQLSINSNAPSSPDVVEVSGSGSAGAVTPVPTLSQWALLLLLGSMLFSSCLIYRRKFSI